MTSGFTRRVRTTMLALLALVTAVNAAPVSSSLVMEESAPMFSRLFPGLRTAKPEPDLIALQAAAVRSIVADITDLHDGDWEDREWVYLAVNHEVLVEEGRRSSSQASVLAHWPGGELEDLDFRLSPASKADLLALRDAMAAADNRTWTILDLSVERSGQYNFAFSYAPPPRLNGNLLHSPLTGLLERYLKERSQ